MPAAAAALPEHSNTMSAPQPSVRPAVTAARSSCAGFTVVTGPSVAASSRLGCTGSAITIRLHPPASAASAVTIPIGPAPITTATSPGRMRALLAACIPTASGSTIAASSKPTLSGIRKVNAAGWTTDGRSTPCTGGVAQKRTAGSRL